MPATRLPVPPVFAGDLQADAVPRRAARSDHFCCICSGICGKSRDALADHIRMLPFPICSHGPECQPRGTARDASVWNSASAPKAADQFATARRV